MASHLRLTSLQALRIAEHVYLYRVDDGADLPPDLAGLGCPAWVIYAAFTRVGALLVRAPSGLPLAFRTQAAAVAAIGGLRPDLEPDLRTDLAFLRPSSGSLPVTSARLLHRAAGLAGFGARRARLAAAR